MAEMELSGCRPGKVGNGGCKDMEERTSLITFAGHSVLCKEGFCMSCSPHIPTVPDTEQAFSKYLTNECVCVNKSQRESEGLKKKVQREEMVQK